MRLELVERLICPSPHERTPMIVVSRRTRERDLLDADLGCMMCRRKALVFGGHVLLHGKQLGSSELVRPAETEGQLNRLEAQLGLSEPGARVLLAGRYAQMADALALSSDAMVVALNVLTGPGPNVGSVFLEEPVVPFSDGSFTAAAFGDDISTPQLLDALRTLQRGARVVGAWPLSVPAGVSIIAQDAAEWVGERADLPGPVVGIQKRRG